MANGSASEVGLAPMEQHGLLDSERLSFDAPDSSLREEAFQGEASPEDARTPQQPPRTLNFLNGVAIVVGIQIGSGIFSTPGSVIGHVHSSTLAVLAWLLAGLMAWTGAASVVQLGTLVPANGGMQEYLSFLYDDSWGFLFAWSWIVISRPCGLAMVSLVFSEYLYKAVVTSGQEQELYLKSIAIMAIVFITLLNCLGTPMGNRMGSLFLALKVVGLLSIPLAGLFYHLFSSASEKQTQHQPRDENGTLSTSGPSNTALGLWHVLGGLTDGILAAVFAYGGWESIGFVAGEIKNVAVTLPRILYASMTMVISLFILANISLYTVVPIQEAETSNTITLDFGSRVAGSLGRVFYAWIVCLSCLGTLHAVVFSAGRLTQAAGSRSYAPKFLERSATPPLVRLKAIWGRRTSSEDTEEPHQNIPANAMLLNAAIACIFVLTGTFRQLLTFKGMVEYALYLITFFGLVLKNLSGGWSKSALAPLLFCVIATIVIARAVLSHPIGAAVILIYFGTVLFTYRVIWRGGFRNNIPFLNSSC